MITIFHGDDQKKSRQAFSNFLKLQTNHDFLKIDDKTVDLTLLSNFVLTQSFISPHKIICIDNFFSLHPKSQEKIISLITQNPDCHLAIWQNKKLTSAQTSRFPNAKVSHFPTPNIIFSCLNAIRPHQKTTFIKLFDQVLNQDLYDLFYFLLKRHLRNLFSKNIFTEENLRSAYLRLIDLEYQYKSGNLNSPQELALKHIILTLID